MEAYPHASLTAIFTLNLGSLIGPSSETEGNNLCRNKTGTHSVACFPGQPGWAVTRKVKPF